MSTYLDLVNSVTSALHSYTGIQESCTWLSAQCGTTDLSLQVNSSDAILRGITEVEDELLYVVSGDSGSLQVAPFGRGYRGSVAASHAVNTQVTFDPVWPRVEIKKALASQIDSLYPNLYQIKTVDLTYSATAIGYVLPDDCDRVLNVTYKVPGDYQNWYEPLYDFVLDPHNPASSGTGRVLNLFDVGQPGSTIHVVYQAAFGTPPATGDATLSSLGIPEGYIDLITYGVAQRMMRFLDPSRVQVAAVENATRSQFVQAGDAGKIANQLYAMYQQRVAEERRRLLGITPPSSNFQR